MPKYPYVCEECSEYTEIFFSIHDDSSTPDCPSCDGLASLKKIYTVPGVSFKGPGFSSNDAKGHFRRANGQGY